MAKATSIEHDLATLRGLDLASPAAREALAKALQSKSSLVAAKAAQLIAKANLAGLSADLEVTFDRFMPNAKSADKGCAAKLAMAQALYEMGRGAERVFLTGIHHIQMEPAFGGPVDTAAELRGVCALGLVRMAYRDVLTELADLLMDSELQPRIMAARALAYADRPEGALLLRVKILAGDREADVMAECFAAILQLAPLPSLPLVARYLDASDRDLAQAAALAIGASRLPQAFELLKARWDANLDPAAREALLVPLAMLRRPEAIDMLVELVRDAHPKTAAAALDALGMYRHDEALRTRVLAAAQPRTEESVRHALAKAFGA